ncbi:type II CAAX prenyl endopeptidase Rce1 family protein [Paenibacillus xylanexedens]|uniref:CPBP family glutamic-type intramembrane protease n=1 Tax=Paenibacillus xylanexedens TaxID=528191 RepID=UPI0011A21FC7
MAILSVPIMIIGGGLEELGWRYILQSLLEKQLGFIGATLVTALILYGISPYFLLRGPANIIGISNCNQ